eukprot:10541692-Ditylum_brightwellii.AAC.1
MMTIKSLALDDIKAGIINDPLEKVVGQPTYNDIDDIQKQSIRNATMLESALGGGANGLACLAVLPQ